MAKQPAPRPWAVMIGGRNGDQRDITRMSVISRHRTASAARRELTGWIVTECEGMHQRPGREGRRIVLEALREKHGVTALTFLVHNELTGVLYARNDLET